MTTDTALTATDAALGSMDSALRRPGARPGPATLRCTTREIDDPGDLIGLLPSAADPLSWVRAGEGLVAWGRTATLDTGGPGRFVDAEAVWRALAARIEVDDEVRLPGTGPVAFASFAFGHGPLGAGERSVLVVPRVVVGRRGGRCWITELGPVADRPVPSWGVAVGDPARLGPLDRPLAVRRPGPLHWSPGAMSATAYRDTVAEAVALMADGPLDKVVLARDTVARFGRPVDPRFLVRALAGGNPHCWTYSVDGLVGATPELLLRRSGALVESRVLAGTTWPGPDAAETVLAEPKYQDEHRYAVDSLRTTLGPYCTRMDLDGPHLLPLPTVTHLSTDLRGHLDPELDPGVLALAGAVHPTAAVGGTPPDLAMETITRLEGRAGLHRGRYAGPVGWVDARGDGELGIALRCAQLSGRTARLFAGCGITADSDPDLELAETAAKLRAVSDALVS